VKLNHNLLASVLIALLVSSPLLAGVGRQNGMIDGVGVAGQQPPLPASDCADCLLGDTVDANESATLTFMREEEKAARDIYSHAAELWQLALFSNIADSEQKHMDSVAEMLAKYELTDPVVDDTAGVFVNSDLQALYHELALRSESSLMDALYVGGLVEEVDIADLQDAIAETDNADLAQTYGNLMRGSRNHLRAFVGEIERQGLVYEAQYLTQEEVDAIVDSPLERGNSTSGVGNFLGPRGMGGPMGPSGRMAW